jgi:hypothetical protein
MPATTPAPATPAFVQPATPVPGAAAPATPIPMPPPQASSHRGLYMTLGALVVLAGLVVAGIYVPRISKTNAKAPDASGMTAPDTTSQAPVQTQQPAAATGTNTPSSQPGAPVATTASVDTSAPVPPAQAPTAAAPAPREMSPAQPNHPRGKKLAAQNNGMASDTAMPAQGDSGMAAPSAGDSANFDEMETELDQLSNRAASVNSSLDRLQQQQAASGFGLRGDMVAKQASMKNNLSKAEDAMQRHDTARAKKYLDLTDRDVEALEKFLGH